MHFKLDIKWLPSPLLTMLGEKVFPLSRQEDALCLCYWVPMPLFLKDVGYLIDTDPSLLRKSPGKGS